MRNYIINFCYSISKLSFSISLFYSGFKLSSIFDREKDNENEKTVLLQNNQ